MSLILAKYATLDAYYFPLFKVDTKDFAIAAEWTPEAGDVKISIDGGNVANTTNLPAAVGGAGSALWALTLTAAELTGKQMTVQLIDVNAKTIDNNAIMIRTYGHASAYYPFDFSATFLTQMTTGLTTALTEGYAAKGAAGSVRDKLYMVEALLTEIVKSGTTLAAKKVDGLTTAATFTLNDASNPTSVTRAT